MFWLRIDTDRISQLWFSAAVVPLAKVLQRTSRILVVVPQANLVHLRLELKLLVRKTWLELQRSRSCFAKYLGIIVCS